MCFNHRAVSRLIKTDLAAARQPNTRADSPFGFNRIRTAHTLTFQQSDYAAQIVAHQIKKASQHGMFCMHLHKFAITRMDRQFGRRQCKYKPAIAEIDRRKFQHRFEERAIGCRVLAVEKKMRSRNHCGSILTSRKMNSLNQTLSVEGLKR